MKSLTATRHGYTIAPELGFNPFDRLYTFVRGICNEVYRVGYSCPSKRVIPRPLPLYIAIKIQTLISCWGISFVVIYKGRSTVEVVANVGVEEDKEIL